ncbi:MAG: tetratricopeptide repeat protein, partial [Elusimicrobiota bacterium]|nr:tetratricopeptide repeat protein [Elusimicrobiota bacterium]
MQKIFQSKNKIFLTLIVLVSIFIYINALKSEFVFDDEFIVEKNTLIRSIKNISQIFVSSYWGEHAKDTLLYRPIVITTFAIDYGIWKLNPFGYHLTNIAINTINCVLLYFFTLLIFSSLSVENKLTQKHYLVAFISGLLFAVHPVHTEAVTNIVGRTELLALFFYISAFMLYVKLNRHFYFYWLSLVCYLLGLLSKEMAITLPGILMLYDMLIYGIRNIKPRIKYYFGYVAVAIGYLILRTLVLGKVAGQEQLWMMAEDTFLTRFFTIIKILGYYVKLLFLPFGLRPEYEGIKAISITEVSVFMPLVLFIFLFIIMKKYTLKKYLLFAIFWFFITILPVSNIIPIGGFIGERFLYLPSIGFCWVVGEFFSTNEKKFFLSFRFIFLITIITFFSVLTIKRNNDWLTDYTLWMAELRVEPNNYKAHYNLGVIAREEKRYNDAEERLKKAIALRPTSIPAHTELAFLYFKQELWDRAIEMYKKSIDLINFYESQGLNLKKDKPGLYRDLAMCYSKKKDFSSSIDSYLKAIEYNPNFANAYCNRGSQYLKKDDFNCAIEDLNKALEINPSDALAYWNRGISFGNTQRTSQAIRDLEQFLQLAPSGTPH